MDLENIHQADIDLNNPKSKHLFGLPKLQRHEKYIMIQLIAMSTMLRLKLPTGSSHVRLADGQGKGRMIWIFNHLLNHSSSKIFIATGGMFQTGRLTNIRAESLIWRGIVQPKWTSKPALRLGLGEKIEKWQDIDHTGS